MKPAYKIALLILCATLWRPQAQAGDPSDKREFTQTIKKEFSITPTGTVALYNKYGKTNVMTWDKDRVKIDVIILVMASTEEEAQRIFNRIQINFTNNTDFVKAETAISSGSSWWNWGSDGGEFSINYDVYLPRTVALDINHKHGDTYVAEMASHANVTIQYGNIRMDGLSEDLNLTLNFGGGAIGKARDINATMSYSNLRFGTIRDLNMESKYSDISVDEGSHVRTTSKYDTYRIGKVEEFRIQGAYGSVQLERVENLSATSKYTDFQVREVANSANLDLEYGAAKVDKVSRGFSDLTLVGRYTDYKITVEEGASYQLQAAADYAGILYPSVLNVTFEKDEGTYHEVNGYIGAKNARSVVKARLDYGGLKMQ